MWLTLTSPGSKAPDLEKDGFARQMERFGRVGKIHLCFSLLLSFKNEILVDEFDDQGFV